MYFWINHWGWIMCMYNIQPHHHQLYLCLLLYPAFPFFFSSRRRRLFSSSLSELKSFRDLPCKTTRSSSSYMRETLLVLLVIIRYQSHLVRMLIGTLVIWIGIFLKTPVLKSSFHNICTYIKRSSLIIK